MAGTCTARAKLAPKARPTQRLGGSAHDVRKPAFVLELVGIQREKTQAARGQPAGTTRHVLGKNLAQQRRMYGQKSSGKVVEYCAIHWTPQIERSHMEGGRIAS